MKKNKKRYNKIIKISLLSFVIVFVVVIITLSAISDSRNNLSKKNNFDALKHSNRIVLFIGDGMGEAHVEVAEKKLSKRMSFTYSDIQGYVDTRSLNLFNPTDSAAAASSMATGIKYKNGTIAAKNNFEVSNILEYARNRGYGTGVITTDVLYGATIAAFTTHVNSRSDTLAIMSQQSQSDHDLYLGAGKDDYAPYVLAFENGNFRYANAYSGLTLTREKYFGVFESIALGEATNETPSLEQLTEYAINYMEKYYPYGYILIIEEARIDKYSHEKDIDNMILAMDELDKAYVKASELLVDKEDYTIILTADHETGNLNYSDDLTENDITNSLYKSASHTSKKVKYYIRTDIQNNFKYPETIDNTDIFKICKSIVESD